jgi:hypothetical protein
MNTQFRRAGGYNASLSYRIPDAEQRARQARLRQYQSGIISRRSMHVPWLLWAALFVWVAGELSR